MLEDRKFFYPVTGEAPAWEMFKPGPRSWDGAGVPYELLVRSPWMVVGGKNAVTMVREGAFVGEHSPRVALPGGGLAAGLVQERLGLQDGREYVGRIVLAADASAAPVEVSLAWGGGGTDATDRDDRGPRRRLRDPRPALPLGRHDRQRPPRDRLPRDRRASRSGPSR